MKKTNVKNCITIVVIAIILIVTQIFFEQIIDATGLSLGEIRVINIAEHLGNIIIPIVIVLTILFKKDLLSILLLALRSFVACIPMLIYAIENGGIGTINSIIIILSVIYIAILLMLWFGNIGYKTAIIAVVISRIMIMLFSGNISNLMYGLKNGSSYLLENTLYLFASELLFIVPLIYCKADKAK